MLNMLDFSRDFFWGGVCPKVPGEIQRIQHFKGFGADKGLKFNILRGLDRLMPPNPLKC